MIHGHLPGLGPSRHRQLDPPVGQTACYRRFAAMEAASGDAHHTGAPALRLGLIVSTGKKLLHPGAGNIGALGIHMAGTPAYVFYGHHKCATMWLNTLCLAVCQRLGLQFDAVYNEDDFSRDLGAYAAQKKAHFISYGNADIEYCRSLPSHRAFHIVRDPRDIVVSAYFSHLKSHSTGLWPELIAHRERLSALSLDEGLLEEIRFRGRSFAHMASWDYEQPHVLEVRFEEITGRSYETLLRIFEHLGLLQSQDYRFGSRLASVLREIRAWLRVRTGRDLPGLPRAGRLPPPDLLTLAWRHRFQAKAAGRAKGQEDTGSHYRKGKSGDWVDHFRPEHKALFKELYPGLVARLGYGSNDDW